MVVLRVRDAQVSIKDERRDVAGNPDAQYECEYSWIAPAELLDDGYSLRGQPIGQCRFKNRFGGRSEIFGARGMKGLDQPAER